MKSTKRKCLLWVRCILMAAFFCVGMSGHYPPAHAQTPPAYAARQATPPYAMPEMSQSDPVQNEQIKELNTHIAATDSRVQAQWTAMSDMKAKQDNLDGVTKMFGWVLTLMVGGSITLQVRKKA